MRTTINLPDEQVEALARFCKKERITRAEAIRRAVRKLLQEEIASTKEEDFRATFGAWKDSGMDGRQYVEKLREEWDHPTQ